MSSRRGSLALHYLWKLIEAISFRYDTTTPQVIRTVMPLIFYLQHIRRLMERLMLSRLTGRNGKFSEHWAIAAGCTSLLLDIGEPGDP